MLQARRGRRCGRDDCVDLGVVYALLSFVTLSDPTQPEFPRSLPRLLPFRGFSPSLSPLGVEVLHAQRRAHSHPRDPSPRVPHTKRLSSLGRSSAPHCACSVLSSLLDLRSPPDSTPCHPALQDEESLGSVSHGESAGFYIQHATLLLLTLRGELRGGGCTRLCEEVMGRRTFSATTAMLPSSWFISSLLYGDADDGD